MTTKRALIFDCDGVLSDTEPFGHLVAFNQMWKNLDVPWTWSRQQYGEKLRIGGGKERMASLFSDPDFLARVRVPESEAEKKALIAFWHKTKTEIYTRIISSGAVPARPGIKRISEEALKAGWQLAVASTSAPEAVEAVLRHAVGDISVKFAILCGDVVGAKKPAPDIYNLALKRLGLYPQQCVAIEDSRNGLLSAYQAGIPVVITVSEYTAEENFSEAALVVDSLGDPDGPKTTVLANPAGASIGECVTLEVLAEVISKWPARNAQP